MLFHQNKEYRKKISQIRLEKMKRLGYLNSPETRKKMRLAKLGKKRKPFKRKPHTIETKLKMSLAHYGEKNYQWKGGIKPESKRIKNSLEYRLWREAVFTRDNWTCQKFKIKGGILHPHHIQNFAQYPELRFAIDNGITLSKKAHDEFHKKYGYLKNTQKQLNEFFKN